jgi:hypothetical protein
VKTTLEAFATYQETHTINGGPILQFVPTQQKLSSAQRRLLALFSELDAQNQESLIAFAEFLASRVSDDDAPEQAVFTPVEPAPIPRPNKESVVKAIQRLSSSYHMLQRDKMLDETSSLMMAHVLQGRSAVSVIDELERLFERHYELYLKQD